MKDLSHLLGRITKSLGKSVLAQETVIHAVYEVCMVKLIPEEVTLKEGVLTFCTSATKNNTLCLKEEKLLQALRERGVKVVRIAYC